MLVFSSSNLLRCKNETKHRDVVFINLYLYAKFKLISSKYLIDLIRYLDLFSAFSTASSESRKHAYRLHFLVYEMWTFWNKYELFTFLFWIIVSTNIGIQADDKDPDKQTKKLCLKIHAFTFRIVLNTDKQKKNIEKHRSSTHLTPL